jgi:hypothetical protein
MAKPLQSIAIQAPGFYGLNTQDSPTGLTEQFALSADNCVIDRFGRIGARKGYKYKVTSPEAIQSLSEYIRATGESELISTTESNIYVGDTSLTSIKPAGYTVSTDYQYSFATVSDIHYIFQEGNDPLYYDGTTCDLVSNHPYASGTIPTAGIGIGAYGRLWATRIGMNAQVIYWSDLLQGMAWDTGSAGSIDLSKVWVGGADEVKGIAAHNGFLFIFGKRQILVYQGAQDPATMSLADSIVGIGCLDHDTIANTGNDLVFLSEVGVRSISRTIQEKSAPIGDLSKNVRNELGSFLNADYNYKASYSPDEAFYILSIVGAGVVYVFDMRGKLEDGSARVTKWNSVNPLCTLYRTVQNDLLLGRDVGIAELTGYLDGVAVDGTGGVGYQMSYFTNYIDFGAPANLKMLKSLKITFIGGSDTEVTLNYGYDYSFAYKKRAFVLPVQNIAEFGIAEYNVGEFNQGILVNRPSINTSSSGAVVQLGVEVNINGSPISVQRMTAQAVIGKVV